VNVDQSTLDRLRQAAMRGNVANTANSAEQLIHLQGRAWTTMRERIGAWTPSIRPAAWPQPRTERAATPVGQSGKSARLLRALEEAHAVAPDVDNERGIEDGFAGVVEHFAAGPCTSMATLADLRQHGRGKGV